MFKYIWNTIKSWIFGKPSPSIRPDGPTVVESYFVLDSEDGKAYKVTKYSDGTTKKEPCDAQDPTGIDDFLDDIR